MGLVTTYGVAVIIGATQGFRNGTGWLAVPIAGPWAAIGARTYECEGPTGTVAEAKRCVRDAVGEVQIITFVAVDGIAQLASAVVTLAGLASSRQELVRKDLLPVDVAVVPPRGREPWRLSVSGTF